MRWYRVAIFSFAVFLGSGGLFADAIRLTSGQVIDGKIIEESPTVVVMETRKGVFAFERSDIVEIEKSGSPKIARVPDTRPSPLAGALMSFIPGVSGLYKTEYSGAGVPFSLVQIALGYRIAKTTFWKSPRGFFESPLAVNTFATQMMISTAGSRSLQACVPSCGPADQAFANSIFDYSRYYVGQHYFETSYAVGKRIYSLRQMRDVRKNAIWQYAFVGALNGAASYYVLSRWSTPVSSLSTPPDVAAFSVYVLPTGRGDVAFGVAAAF